MNLVAIYWTGTYIVSRIRDRRLWRRRRQFFSARDRVYPSDPLERRIIKTIANHFAVDWRRIQPEDRLNTELLLPDAWLHDHMLSDVLDTLEYFVEEAGGNAAWNLTDDDIEDISVGSIIAHVRRMLAVS